MQSFKTLFVLGASAVSRIVELILRNKFLALVALIVGLWPVIQFGNLIFIRYSTPVAKIDMGRDFYSTESSMEKTIAEIYALPLGRIVNMEIEVADLYWYPLEIYPWDYFNEIESSHNYAEEYYIRPGVLPVTNHPRFQLLMSSSCHPSTSWGGTSFDESCDEIILFVDGGRYVSDCYDTGKFEYSEDILQLARESCDGGGSGAFIISIAIDLFNKNKITSTNGNFSFSMLGELQVLHSGGRSTVLRLVAQ